MSGLEALALKAFLYAAKGYAAILVSLGGMAINAAGVQLGIAPLGTKLTDMDFSEIFQSLKTFASKLDDPRIQYEVSQIIKLSADKVKDAIILLVTLAQETANASSKEICKMPLLTNACKVSELTQDILDVAIDKVQMGLKAGQTGGKMEAEIQEMISKNHKIKNRIDNSVSDFLRVSIDKSKANKNKDKDKDKPKNKTKNITTYKSKTKKRNYR